MLAGLRARSRQNARLEGQLQEKGELTLGVVNIPPGLRPGACSDTFRA